MAEELHSFHRSERDRFVAGVCGGLAETWHVDSTLVRLGWVFFTLVFFQLFLGIAIYLVAWFVLPVQSPAGPAEEEQRVRVTRNRQFGQVCGWLLIGIGLFYLIERLSGGLVQEFLREFRRYLWPILLIALGGALLLYRGPKGKPPEEDKP